jgi:lipopolysaccharide export system protein LptA
MEETRRLALKDRVPWIISTLSLIVLLATITVIVVTIVRRSRQVQTPAPLKAPAVLSGQVVSITEGYRYTTTENGKRKFQLIAARDTSYADGHHELEHLDLTSYTSEGKENLRIFADHGIYQQEQGLVNLAGNVKVSNQDGLEVTTDNLVYNQKEDFATSDGAIQFKRGPLSGASTGASFNAKVRTLSLYKDVVVTSAPPENAKESLPVVARAGHADFAQGDGILRLTTQVLVTQGTQSGRAETVTGVFDPATKKLIRIEMRGQSSLRSDEPENLSSIEARDIDFYFDEKQIMHAASAAGAARATSLQKEAPREMVAEKLDAGFIPSKTGSLLQTVSSQGRTTLKIASDPAAAKTPKGAESSLEADALKVSMAKDGKFMSDAEAAGNVILVTTPLVVTPVADRKRVRAAKVRAHFFETNNIVESFVGEGGAVVELEPLAKDSKRNRRTLTGNTVTGRVNRATEDLSDLVIDGDAKVVDGKREGNAARATYTAANETVLLRGKPVIWDESARANADEIDANLREQESLARGRVRTTYYSRETTGGAAPFKKSKSPVFVTSERALIKHAEGVARYTGDVRIWQDDNFVSAETIELDNKERQMLAWTNVESAVYSVERETEDGKKEIVPTFASAERMSYRDESRLVHYEGKVRIRQGTDRVEAAVADALLDQDNKLTQLTASKDVVLTQPQRRGTGDQLVYTAEKDTAVLTGNLAQVEDKDRGLATKGARLTMHLRDARIEVNDESGAKRVRTTHRIQR